MRSTGETVERNVNPGESIFVRSRTVAIFISNKSDELSWEV